MEYNKTIGFANSQQLKFSNNAKLTVVIRKHNKKILIIEQKQI
jgi:hypothetical protein